MSILYISKLPPKAKEDNLFYVKPLTKVPTDNDSPWYCPVPIGKNILANMVKKMCSEAKIQGSKTNHSLRATAATQMFQQGVPEKLIQERTGHRSLEGLRSYERLCESQHRAVSNLLSSNEHKLPVRLWLYLCLQMMAHSTVICYSPIVLLL